MATYQKLTTVSKLFKEAVGVQGAYKARVAVEVYEGEDDIHVTIIVFNEYDDMVFDETTDTFDGCDDATIKTATNRGKQVLKSLKGWSGGRDMEIDSKVEAESLPS